MRAASPPPTRWPGPATNTLPAMARRTVDLTPDQLARRRAVNRDYMARTRGPPSGIKRRGHGGAVPDKATLEERDRRLSVVLTPNQELLGDPVPGRSWLDRMGVKA